MGAAKSFFDPSSENFNFQDLQAGANQAGKYANIAYNLKRGQEPVDYYQGQFNPEYDKSIDLMSNREFDADPLLKETRGTYDKTKDIIQDMSGGNSAIALANIGGAQIRRDNALQRILTDKDNRDNAYRAEEAKFRANMGSEKARELSNVEINKLKADAVRDLFTGTAMNDISKVSQMNTKMLNEKETDEGLLKLLQGEYGDLSNLAEILKFFR